MTFSPAKFCAPLLAGSLLAGGLLAPSLAFAQSAEQFYKAQKNMTIVVGSAAGGSYDTYARTTGRFLSKYLPGSPTFITNNLPGGGGMRAANYLYNVAPKDGSTLMIMARAIPTAPLLYGEESKAQFDATKFTWVGSLVKEMGMGVVSKSAPATTLDEMKTTEITMGVSGIEGDPAMYARLFNYLYGTKFKNIAGYQGQPETMAAVEKGEVHGLFLSGWSGSGRALVRDRVAEGKWKLFVQMGLEKDPEFPDVPTIMDVMTNPEDQAVLKFLFGRQILGQPFTAPPGLPADRVAMLRAAFRSAVDDPGMRQELERQRFALSAVYGEDAERIMKELYATPDDVIKRAQSLVKIGM
ncbi:MAG TPA: tripartite tricarboxylate transporter substrate-binding protein [Alphaproteobacteria bacterium]|jgi:tripartite-type tricarboxylate transporter receptor subunit TctC